MIFLTDDDFQSIIEANIRLQKRQGNCNRARNEARTRRRARKEENGTSKDCIIFYECGIVSCIGFIFFFIRKQLKERKVESQQLVKQIVKKEKELEEKQKEKSEVLSDPEVGFILEGGGIQVLLLFSHTLSFI